MKRDYLQVWILLILLILLVILYRFTDQSILIVPIVVLGAVVALRM